MPATSHMLTIADLHNAAPGVLDVVTGPDGDFPNAPPFDGPILVGKRWVRIASLNEQDGRVQVQYPYGDEPGPEFVQFKSAAFDLRVRSVFDHFARLCALVCLKHIGVTEPPVSVYVYDGWDRCALEVHTCGKDPYKQRNFCWDGADGGGNVHFVGGEKRELFHLPVEVVARPAPDHVSFLAALTLHIAPQMVALRSTLRSTLPGVIPDLLLHDSPVLITIDSDLPPVRGVVIDPVHEPDEADPRCIVWHSAHGRDNKAKMFVALDLTIPAGREHAARWAIPRIHAPGSPLSAMERIQAHELCCCACRHGGMTPEQVDVLRATVLRLAGLCENKA